MAASVGLQFSRQSFELPSFAGLDKLGALFGFHMDRTDLLVPLAFSLQFGTDEKFGAISFGAVGGYTFLDYGLAPNGLVKDVSGVPQLVAGVTRKQGFATYGAFVFLKGGYRFTYVGLGLAGYYQDYGTFKLMDTVDTHLNGFTLVPCTSFEFRY